MNSEDCDSQEHLTYREEKYQRKNYRKKKNISERYQNCLLWAWQGIPIIIIFTQQINWL